MAGAQREAAGHHVRQLEEAAGVAETAVAVAHLLDQIGAGELELDAHLRLAARAPRHLGALDGRALAVDDAAADHGAARQRERAEVDVRGRRPRRRAVEQLVAARRHPQHHVAPGARGLQPEVPQRVGRGIHAFLRPRPQLLGHGGGVEVGRIEVGPVDAAAAAEVGRRQAGHRGTGDRLAGVVDDDSGDGLRTAVRSIGTSVRSGAAAWASAAAAFAFATSTCVTPGSAEASATGASVGAADSPASSHAIAPARTATRSRTPTRRFLFIAGRLGRHLRRGRREANFVGTSHGNHARNRARAATARRNLAVPPLRPAAGGSSLRVDAQLLGQPEQAPVFLLGRLQLGQLLPRARWTARGNPGAACRAHRARAPA